MAVLQTVLNRTQNLNYDELRQILPDNISDVFVEDYLDKQENIVTVATGSDALEVQVIENTARLDVLEPVVEQNVIDINTNEGNIATNTTNIATNTSNIATNTANIATNTGNITTVTNNFNTHDASDSEHGVTGVNVGTLDFAQTATGGVVLLADLVADVTATTTVIATADVGVAPVAYDQAYAQEQTDLINECKTKINSLINNDVLDLITQFNDLLQQMKDANQMSTT